MDAFPGPSPTPSHSCVVHRYGRRRKRPASPDRGRPYSAFICTCDSFALIFAYALMRPSAAAGFVQAPIHAGTLHLSASPVVSATTRFGRNRPRPSDDDESMMNYLARSEAKRGPSSTSTGFGRPNQRYPHDLARGRTDGIDPPPRNTSSMTGVLLTK